jgi:hypothetical protein
VVILWGKKEGSMKELEYTVLISESETFVNRELGRGWKIESVTASHLCSSGVTTIHGKFCFVLSREKKSK